MSTEGIPSGTGIDATVAEATDQIAALLTDEETEEPHGEDTQDATAPEGDDGAEPEAEDAEDSDPADDEAPAPEPAVPAAIRLSDGTELTVEEVEKGYLRQADYTKKTQAVAEERRTVQAEKTQAAEARAAYAERIQQLDAYLQSVAPQPPPADLRTSDPAEWAARNSEYLAWQQQRTTLTAEQQRVLSEQARDVEAQRQEVLAVERDRLLQKFPAWQDQQKAAADLAEMRDFALASGFSEQELGDVVDHRAIELLWKAKEYDKQQRAVKSVQPKIAKAPVLKPGTTGRVVAKSAPDVQRHAKALKQSGKISDAQKLIAEMFK